MQAFQAVVFDLDGTLADTLEDIAASMNHSLATLGLPGYDLDTYRRYVGEGAPVLAQRAVGEDHQDLADQALAEFKRHYAAHCFDHSGPYEGVPEVLDALAAQGVAMTVLSNKPDVATQQVVRRLFARWSFAAVAGQKPDIPRKPDPAGALAIAEAMGVEPARCAFVGDTWIDLETASAAGMYGIGVLWGFRDRAELEAAGAKAIIAHPAELLDVVPWEACPSRSRSR